MNATVQLAANSTMDSRNFENSLKIAPNPILNKELKLYNKTTATSISEFTLYDTMGRLLKKQA